MSDLEMFTFISQCFMIFQGMFNGFNTLFTQCLSPYISNLPFSHETDSHICTQIHFTFMYPLTAAAYHLLFLTRDSCHRREIFLK